MTEGSVTDRALPGPTLGPRHGAADEQLPKNWTGPILLAAAIVCWLLGLPSLGSAGVSQWGLLATGSPLFGVSIGLVIVAFLVCIRHGRLTFAAAAVIAEIAILRGSVSLATSAPYYPWTYKHLAVTDYIAQHGSVDRSIDIYHSWPGLFAATAWFSQVTGVAPITIAHWFTPLAHLAMFGLILVLMRAWQLPTQTALVAGFLFESLNFVGQDYFSPQATAFILGLGVLICLRRRAEPRLTMVALGLFAAITVTHQLTPYWLLLVSFGLLLLRRLTPVWLPFAFAAIAGGYLAVQYHEVSGIGLFSSGANNASTGIATTALTGARLSWYGSDALYAALFVAVAAILFRRFRRGEDFLAPAVLALAPILILAVQNYGGEAIWRVYLYCLPGLVLVIAPGLTALILGRLRTWCITAIIADAGRPRLRADLVRGLVGLPRDEVSGGRAALPGDDRAGAGQSDPGRGWRPGRSDRAVRDVAEGPLRLPRRRRQRHRAGSNRLRQCSRLQLVHAGHAGQEQAGTDLPLVQRPSH